jgi:hypothetical protein
MTTVPCPYCQRPARYLASSAPVYGGREYGPIWLCAPCDARTPAPLGPDQPPERTLANGPTRGLRKRAHELFDPLWHAVARRDHMSRTETRSRAYAWLSSSLDIPPDQCHFGMMQEPDLRRAITLLLSVYGR